MEKILKFLRDIMVVVSKYKIMLTVIIAAAGCIIVKSISLYMGISDLMLVTFALIFLSFFQFFNKDK